MAFFSSSFSFESPSSRPQGLYTYGTAADNVSPTSSRCGSPLSPSTTCISGLSSSNSSTDDLVGLTTNLSSSSLYTGSSRHCLPNRRSPPRSTPFALPPTSSQQAQSSTEMFARRERRQAYVADQLSGQSRRKLSLLVARILGDDIEGSHRRHPSAGLHPSNVRVVPAMPSAGSTSRRNTLIELRRGVSDSSEESIYPKHPGATSEGLNDTLSYSRSSDSVHESIEIDLPVRPRASSNRITKRSPNRGSSRKTSTRPK